MFLTTTSVVILQRQETAEAKRELEEYRLSAEGRVADAKREGIEAGKTAGDALLRAAELKKGCHRKIADRENKRGCSVENYLT